MFLDHRTISIVYIGKLVGIDPRLYIIVNIQLFYR